MVIQLGLLALLAASLALPLRAEEGYDPMLQISNQFAKPNLLIVLDVTGSMAWVQTSSTSVGIDTFGLPTFSWTSSMSAPTWVLKSGPTRSSSRCGGTSSNPKYTYTCVYTYTATFTYTLRATSRQPSRMDVFKNALGNSVPLYDGSTFTWPDTWPVTYPNWTYIGNGQWTKTVTRDCSQTSLCIYPPTPAYSCNGYSGTCTPSAPGAPFTAGWSIPDYSRSPAVKALIDDGSNQIDVGIAPSRLPQDIVGLNKNSVNWGLMTFANGTATRLINVIPDDSTTVQNTVASDLQAYMKPHAISTTLSNGTVVYGLGVNGGTNTSYGLNIAKRSLAATYATGGPSGGKDPKADLCGRIYAAVLVTDGESNTCNPSGAAWSCGSSYSTWVKYPAGRTSELWREITDSNSDCTTTDKTAIPVRTFVIGVSSDVARCELNLDAFFGRTDASSPNGDAGIKIESDYTVVSGVKQYRLPPRVPTNFKTYFMDYRGLASLPTPLSTTATEGTANYRPVDGSTCGTTGYPPCLDYAYFATNATAIYDAFSAILGAVAAGDYTTSAPVATSSVGTGTLAILASTEYPTWKGHLWAFDQTKNDGTAGYVKWDAGWNLAHAFLPADDTATPWTEGTTTNPAYVSPNNRKIYTWNPSTNALVQVTTANLATLNTACGACGLTTSDVNFMLGYNGSSGTSTTVRPWILSSTINSTPAIIQSPEKFQQNNLESHATFETTNKNRTPLVWVGADDGMLHAFQVTDGKEVLALIPPNLLAMQPQLRAHYHVSKAPTGQPGLPQNHIYGLASSPRYGDAYFSADSSYKTLLLLTEGPGGNLIAGIDATDPVGNLAGSGDPVTIQWTKTGSTWPGLYQTWSTPAAGASAHNSGSTASAWTGLVGSGFNPASTQASPVVPKALMFDATTGTLHSTQPTLSNHGTPPNALLGNQTFADSVIYQMSAPAFYPDNIVDLALQADLNGQIWFMPGPNFTSCSVGIDATTKAAQQQPIYYPPAVNAYEVGGGSFDLYAFGSGTVYEKATTVTGVNVGTTGNFFPSLYLVVKPQDISPATTDQILRIPIKDLYVPEDLTVSPCDDVVNQELVGTYQQRLCRGTTHVLLGRRTQITAPPALFVPIAGVTGDPVAVFLVYDPDQGCAGEAYIVKLTFSTNGTTGSGVQPRIKETVTYDAGEGAASGFAVAGNSVIIAKSSVGQGSRAGVNKVPGLNPTAGMSNPIPVWWRELK
jgi:hypothetical protein